MLIEVGFVSIMRSRVMYINCRVLRAGKLFPEMVLYFVK